MDRLDSSMKLWEFGRAFEVILRKELQWSGAFSLVGLCLGTGLKKFKFIFFQDSITVPYLVLGVCLWGEGQRHI